MKNIILLSAIVFGFSLEPFAQTEEKVTLTNEAQSILYLEKKFHDFDTIEEGVEATVTFTFKNTGNAPLILDSVKASCGCTTPKWTTEPIVPGEEGVITAIYHSYRRPGIFAKTITVMHNGEGGTEFLTIRGVVKKTPIASSDAKRRSKNNDKEGKTRFFTLRDLFDIATPAISDSKRKPSVITKKTNKKVQRKVKKAATAITPAVVSPKN